MARPTKRSSKKQIAPPKIVRPEDTNSVLEDVRRNFKRLGLGPSDIQDAVNWSRSKKSKV